ncbi:DEAD/DEAH box helicase [Paenibacillus pini]|uniref:ATP-dependent RNA helicase YfmL n=1 Tax=Paenibacillus pini JCM 16418 TaxID=1236976 RepID=W7YCM5_9BACL|nr:DEAD/DEAH box helicase [Paenibacillus pini]GAF08655.1 ATP-dependent RNA helicase YfmL [Paenibacillus pini JCM 16418]
MSSTTFEAIGLNTDLNNKLMEFGITEPSPVQVQAIPAILSGADVLARSQTGTGKTLAYLLPLLQSIDPELKSTQKLILAPTQELAMQIVREGEKYGEQHGIGVLGLIGGAAVKRQVEKLRLHPQLVVGTPGRVRELIEVRKLKMHTVSTIVVDEVDQVFQLGGAGDVDRILRSALRDRQLVFLSATVSADTANLVKREMNQPVEIGIDPDQSTAAGLSHYYFVSEERDKMNMLRRLIHQYKTKKAIVFVNMTETIGEVEAKLNHLGIAAKALYGDADKMARSSVLSGFRSGKFRVLVASDVAARGLDIEGLDVVVNYDPPTDSEHYVHRAGRTGRMGRTGTVLSIVTSRQLFIMKKFTKELQIQLDERTLFGGKVVDPASAPQTEREGNRRDKKELSADNSRRSSETRAPEMNSGTPIIARKPLTTTNRPITANSSVVTSKPVQAESNRNGSKVQAAPETTDTAQGTPTDASPKKEAFRGGKPAEMKRLSKSEKERARKNKGAPKWLKDKPSRD